MNVPKRFALDITELDRGFRKWWGEGRMYHGVPHQSSRVLLLFEDLRPETNVRRGHQHGGQVLVGIIIRLAFLTLQLQTMEPTA